MSARSYHTTRRRPEPIEFQAECHHCFDGGTFATADERRAWTEEHLSSNIVCEVTYTERAG